MTSIAPAQGVDFQPGGHKDHPIEFTRDEGTMKLLMAVFGATLVMSLAIYSTLRLGVGIGGESAFEVAGFPLLASGHLYEGLERRLAKEGLLAGTDERLVDLAGFALKWYQFLPLAILLFLGAVNAISAYIAFAATATDNDFSLQLIGLLELPGNMGISFLIGRWLGSRSRSLPAGMGLFVIAVVLSLIADRTALILLAESDPGGVAGKAMAQWGSVQFFALGGVGVGVYGSMGCLGLWRGWRQKMTRYVSYLLKVIPKASRDTLVSLAFDEAEASRRAVQK